MRFQLIWINQLGFMPGSFGERPRECGRVNSKPILMTVPRSSAANSSLNTRTG
jgi:hypothetical protein